MFPVLAICLVAQDGGPPVKRGPDVSESQQHDTSPPLRDIPPAKRKPGKKVHPVKPIPRPHKEEDPK
jgi:hypothetical protein